MAELKTKENDQDVTEFIASLKEEGRQEDCTRLMKLMKKVTGSPAKMWGSSIVGFGKYTYVYASGRSGDWFICGFSPRKANLSVYLNVGFEKYKTQLDKLGKYKLGKGCLYLQSIDDKTTEVLSDILQHAIKNSSAKK
jgi:hypothetical protein